MTIRPEIFDKAADIILEGKSFTCVVLEFVNAYKEELKLWGDMHREENTSYWFGYPTGPKNQMIREQCLREVRLNMEAQGFYE